jgi:hypothetical protein
MQLDLYDPGDEHDPIVVLMRADPLLSERDAEFLVAMYRAMLANPMLGRAERN